jgi:hypothetical protein
MALSAQPNYVVHDPGLSAELLAQVPGYAQIYAMRASVFGRPGERVVL